MPKGHKPTASQLQASIQAARELLRSGKYRLRMRSAAGPIRPTATSIPKRSIRRVEREGRIDRAASRGAPGLRRDRRALVDGGADINQPDGG